MSIGVRVSELVARSMQKELPISIGRRERQKVKIDSSKSVRKDQ
jgi:hypothetical protein